VGLSLVVRKRGGQGPALTASRGSCSAEGSHLAAVAVPQPRLPASVRVGVFSRPNTRPWAKFCNMPRSGEGRSAEHTVREHGAIGFVPLSLQHAALSDFWLRRNLACGEADQHMDAGTRACLNARARGVTASYLSYEVCRAGRGVKIPAPMLPRYARG